MAYQSVDIGSVADDGTGDNLRVAIDKINDNFQEIYTLIGDESSLTSGISATATVVTLTAPTISGVVGGTQTSATITTLTGTTFSAGTLTLAAGSITDSSGAISFGNENLTTTGSVTAASLDISGDVDIDGSLETDALTIAGITLAETISDTVGAMVSSNTETNITVTYEDSNNTLDFVIGTLNQDTTGSAATLTTARTIGGVSFDGSANINLPGVNTAGNQNTSGTAAVATTVTITDNESTNENNAIIFTAGGDVDGGNLGLESDGTLTYNPSTGVVTATGFVGALTGNVTGNASGTAATVTGAAQTNITSLGTLTALDVDNININGNTITASSGAVNITPAGGSAIVLDGTVNVDAGVVTGVTSLTSNNILIADAGTIGSASDTDAIAISSAGVVAISSTTSSSSATTGALTVAGGVGISENLSVGERIRVKSDGGHIFWGAGSDVKLSHIHNSGLRLTHDGTGDNLPVIFQLKSEEDAIEINEVIASLEFAAGDSDGTDGATVAAGIHAIAEGTFSASANATKLVFTTGVSETAAASATAKMTLSSAGLLTIADDFVIKDGGTIGVASDTDAITIASDGVATFSQGLTVSGGSSGDTLLTLSTDRPWAFEQSGDDASTALNLKSSSDSKSFNIVNSNGDIDFQFFASHSGQPLLHLGEDVFISFEGSTANGSETILTVANPTGDRTITLPDETGTVHTSGGSITIPDAGTIGSASDTDAIAISSGGVVNISATTTNTSTTSGALTVAGGVGIAENLTVGEKLRLKSDGAQLFFGASSELKFFHTADHGLALVHSGGTGDNLPVIFQLKSEEDAIVADEVIASLEFAAGDSDGTDGATVAAGIHAIAEDTFSATVNKTRLSFTTGVSETAAASATAKMTLSSAGNLGIGTTAPSQMLHLQSTGDAIILLEADTDNSNENDNPRIMFSQDGGGATARIGYTDGLNTFEVFNEYGDDLLFGTNNTERMRIKNAGNVEIHADLLMDHDGALISFGANDEINLTHVHDTGITTNGEFTSTVIRARKPIKTEFNASGSVTASLTAAESGATILIHGTENNVINLPAAATTNPGLYYDFIVMTAVGGSTSTIVNIAGSGGNFVGALSLAGGTAANAVFDNAGDAFTFVSSTVVGSRARITCLTDDGTDGVWQVESLASPIATID